MMLRCKVCKTRFASSGGLERHVKTNHNGDREALDYGNRSDCKCSYCRPRPGRKQRRVADEKLREYKHGE